MYVWVISIFIASVEVVSYSIKRIPIANSSHSFAKKYVKKHTGINEMIKLVKIFAILGKLKILLQRIASEFPRYLLQILHDCLENRHSWDNTG